MATAEIRTQTRREKREVDVTYERVVLDLSIQEAHFLRGLVGNCPGSIARDEFGVSLDAFWDLWEAFKVLGHPTMPLIDIRLPGAR
jgi:hypothetical protein